jgi:hypothetical protein
MVRPERSLLVRSVSMAIRMASLVSARLIAPPLYSSERKATIGSSREALRAR